MTPLLTPEFFYALAGLILLALAARVAGEPAHPQRWGTAAFWALLGGTFLLGKWLPAEWIGAAVVAMTLLAACGQVAPPAREAVDLAARTAHAARLGARLFWPTIVIPVVVIAGGFLLPLVRVGKFTLVTPAQANTCALGLACIAAIGAAMRITRAPASVPFTHGSRLLQAIGWALILPQMLAALGGIFTEAGVGEVIARGVSASLPAHLPLVAVVAYCAAMALFTIVMGNAFAAFAVVTLGIGLPFIVREHGGNPAIMGALGMLAGYCGTLLTPMAANFNIVPALLLEIEDRHAIIRAQAPFAIAMWVFNVLLMWLCVYRF